MNTLIGRYVLSVWLGVIGGMAVLSCDEDEDPVSEQDFTPLEKQLIFVRNLMHSEYFWADYTPDLDAFTYPSPEELLDALMYKEKDRWSFLMSEQEWDMLVEQSQVIGFGFDFVSDGEALGITVVYPDSPAGRAGLQRGDKVVAIDGLTIPEYAAQFEYLPSESGVNATLRIDRNGSIFDAVLTTEIIQTTTVLHHSLLAGNVGYLVFQSFYEKSFEELGVAFTSFHQAGVKSLVLDLRYNGGGQLKVALYLAKMLLGDKVQSIDVYQYLSFNEEYAQYNMVEIFGPPEPEALDLDTLIVLTTAGTASASEEVINGLKPYLNADQLILIGSKSHGKLVGMIVNRHEGIVVLPIQFQLTNALGEGGEDFGGFDPRCVVQDDLTRDLGDPQEAMLAEALSYLQTGQCSAPSGSGQAPLREKTIPIIHSGRPAGAWYPNPLGTADNR